MKKDSFPDNFLTLLIILYHWFKIIKFRSTLSLLSLFQFNLLQNVDKIEIWFCCRHRQVKFEKNFQIRLVGDEILLNFKNLTFLNSYRDSLETFGDYLHMQRV